MSKSIARQRPAAKRPAGKSAARGGKQRGIGRPAAGQQTVGREALITRTKTAQDNPNPSGNGVMVGVLARLFYLTGNADHRQRAEAIEMRLQPAKIVRFQIKPQQIAQAAIDCVEILTRAIRRDVIGAPRLRADERFLGRRRVHVDLARRIVRWSLACKYRLPANYSNNIGRDGCVLAVTFRMHNEFA